MYKIKNNEYAKNYISLMDSIKEINNDWLNIRNSKEYKYGNLLSEIKANIRHGKFLILFKSLKRKLQGQSGAKIRTNTDTIHIDKIESNYFSDKKIAIYTSVFGKYDNLLEPLFLPDNCDFFVITDLEVDSSSAWKKIDTLPEMANMSNVEKNRYVKINPHLLFKDYDYSIYVDGNIKIMSDLTEYIHMLNEVGIGTHLHHLRNCVYDELIAINKSKKDTKENIATHRKLLDEDGMPKKYGLLQCSVIVREHNNPTCVKIMNEWWNEFKNYSKRDQISLPHVLYSNGITVDKVGVLGNNIYKNPSFRIMNHK